MTQLIPNEAGQLVFSGLKEVIGVKELNTMLASGKKGRNVGDQEYGSAESKDDQADNLETIQAVIEKQFSLKEIQGLFYRCGRASCKFFVKHYGPDMKVTSMEYRLQPSRMRLAEGINAAAGQCSELFKKNITIVDAGDQWIWQAQALHPDRKVSESGHDCFFTMGLLQEFLSWISGGKSFPIRLAEEGAAEGESYNLKIGKQPMD